MATIEKYELLKEKANNIVRNRSLLATGGGGIPIPFVDTAVVLSIQIWMLRDLAKLYEVSFKKHLAKSLIISLVSNLSVIGTVKLIPIVGTVIGSVTYGLTSGAATYALGKLFTQHFDQGGTLVSCDPLKSREYFQDYYKEGAMFLDAQNKPKITVTAATTGPELRQANQELMLTINSLQKQLAENQTASPTLVPEPTKKRSWWKIILVILLLLILVEGIGWGVYILWGDKTETSETSLLDASANEDGKELENVNAPPTESSAIAESLKEEPIPEDTDTGLGAEDFGFDPNSTEGQMADYLLDENALIPKTFVLTDIKFTEGQITIDGTGEQQIAHIAELMQSYPNVKVRIYGHTDSGNRVIGRERAQAIKTILRDNGVKRRNIISSLIDKPITASTGAEIEIINR